MSKERKTRSILFEVIEYYLLLFPLPLQLQLLVVDFVAILAVAVAPGAVASFASYLFSTNYRFGSGSSRPTNKGKVTRRKPPLLTPVRYKLFMSIMRQYARPCIMNCLIHFLFGHQCGLLLHCVHYTIIV